MSAPPKSLVAAGFLALLLLPLVLGLGTGVIPGFLVDPSRPGELLAPPEVRLVSPRDGDGVGPRVIVEGEARTAHGLIRDVQVRLDGQRWLSIPDMPRGLPSVVFAHPLDLPPGDHLVEVRAYDGESFSLSARATIRSAATAPPTVRVLSPADGDGVEAGAVTFRGTVRSDEAPRVTLRDGNASTVEALVVPGTAGEHAWTATMRLPPGERHIAVHAVERLPGIPAAMRVMAAPTLPPTVRIATPLEGSAFGSRGDTSCETSCILLSGLVQRGDATPRSVRVLVDGATVAGSSADLDRATGAWTYRLPLAGLFSGEHRATVSAEADDDTTSVPQSVRFLVRTPRALHVAGDDAPRFTGTPLRFALQAEGLDDARWTLDGTPVGKGREIEITLVSPGDHVLLATATSPDGRGAAARLPLYALNRPPVATLTASAGLAAADLPFQASAHDPDGQVEAYRWEFGDGNATTTPASNVTHLYREAGLYRVNLTPIDDHGLAGATVSTLLPVTNAPPLAAFTWGPEAPTAGEAVTFRDGSTDLDGRIVARSWSFPDGTVTDEASPTHRFQQRGPQRVVLRVVDDQGAATELAQLVAVQNVPATVRFNFTPEAPQTSMEVLFSDQSLKTDGRIVGWLWDFGDGETSTQGPAALHTYREPGEHEVRLEVLDDFGARSNATLRIAVLDSPPDVRQVIVEPESPRAHDEVRFRAVAVDRDGAIVRHEWSFGDNATSSLDAPSHRYARSGLYQGRVTVFDQGGHAMSLPFAVLVENAPPEARLADPVGGYAAFPTLLRVDARDPDGRLVGARFDADGDGLDDCDGAGLECAFTYTAPGVYRATAWVQDDEGAVVSSTRLIDIVPPPSGLAPPAVVVDSPLPRAFLRGEQMLTGTTGGVRPVERVEVQLRNGSWAFAASRTAWMAAEGNASWRLLLDTRGFVDGPYDLVVRATDTAGGVGFASVPIAIGNGERESRVSLRLLDRPAELEGDALVRGSAWHPEGITAVRWRVDDGPWRLVDGPAIAFGVPLSRSDFAPGEHTLRIAAYRGLAESREEAVTFRVAGEPPILLVDEPPTYVAYGLLHAAGRVVGGQVEWRLDHGVWQQLPGSGEWRLDRLTHDIPAGNHTLALRAVSPDGSLVSEPRTWRVHLVNPSGDGERRDLDIGSAGEVGPRSETPLGAPLVLVAVGLALALRRSGALPPRI